MVTENEGKQLVFLKDTFLFTEEKKNEGNPLSSLWSLREEVSIEVPRKDVEKRQEQK